MDNFFKRLSKFVSDNPQFILFIIIVQFIIILWLFIKSRNIIGNFKNKSNIFNKNKVKEKNKEKNSDSEEDIESVKPSKTNNVTRRPNDSVSQLVKDINQNI